MTEVDRFSAALKSVSPEVRNAWIAFKKYFLRQEQRYIKIQETWQKKRDVQEAVYREKERQRYLADKQAEEAFQRMSAHFDKSNEFEVVSHYPSDHHSYH